MSEQGMTLAPGTILERRYRILAEGTIQDLGTAYQAHDIQQGQQVSLLVLDPRWGGGERALHRLEELQRAVADLAAPGLLPYEHVGMAERRLYVVRGRAGEQSLADLRRQGSRMEIGKVLELGIQMCEALAPAHRAGFVHGSLSPQSVLLGALPNTETPGETSVTLLDSGLLPALHGEALAQGHPWGRIPYLSPEQAAGEQVHAASDVYVIGCLLYEMLTGRPPFRTSDEMVLALQHLRHEPPSLQVLVPHVPLALAKIVHRAMAKEPAVRYRNAGQLAYILKAQVGGEPAEQPAAAPQTAWERLVVPPPPAPSQVADWTAREVYELEDDDDWSDEPAGVDWLMVGLLIAALIAVLGLIPLWRTVYRRYTGAPSASGAGLRIRFEQQPLGPDRFSETWQIDLPAPWLLPEAAGLLQSRLAPRLLSLRVYPWRMLPLRLKETSLRAASFCGEAISHWSAGDCFTSFAMTGFLVGPPFGPKHCHEYSRWQSPSVASGIASVAPLLRNDDFTTTVPEAEGNLNVWALVWYNSMLTQSSGQVGSKARAVNCFGVDKTVSRSKVSLTGTPAYRSQRQGPSLGVQLTGFSTKV